MPKLSSALILLAVLATPPDPRNLVVNGDASRGQIGWNAIGEASIEGTGADARFVIRNKGSFEQGVRLPPASVGQFLVLVARGTSERVNADGAITGLPYVYGMVLRSDGARIVAYLQGQQMLARPVAPSAWVTMAGVFAIPEGAALVTIQLKQAERAGVPQNGSAAQFDDVGAYIFPSERQARSLIADWPTPKPFYPRDGGLFQLKR